jgi:DNA-directed RNA polymerase specialized sigma24 family protein
MTFMAQDGSVSRWIEALKAGDTAAASRVWGRFSRRLQALARPRSQPTVTGGAYDEEDVALSAFAHFCFAVQKGRYPDLQGRDELWKLLARITMRKARDRAEHAQAQKRGGGTGQSIQEAALGLPGDLDGLASQAPTPDLLAMMTEQCQLLLELLNDPELESVALARLAGQTNDEIAQEMGYTRRTIQNMLCVIRQRWEVEGQ